MWIPSSPRLPSQSEPREDPSMEPSDRVKAPVPFFYLNEATSDVGSTDSLLE